MESCKTLNFKCVAKEPSKKSKTNAELLSVDGVGMIFWFGFDSTLESTTVDAVRTKIALFFNKKGYPSRKGRGKLSRRYKCTFSL